MHQPKRYMSVSKTWGVLRGRMGVVLHANPILPKASPLDSRRAFGAALLTLLKRQERHKKKRKATSRFQRQRTLRITAEEDERMTRQDVTAGISVSEYMRRLGGLLKHHFDVVKRTGNAGTLLELDAALREIRHAIEALSERR